MKIKKYSVSNRFLKSIKRLSWKNKKLLSQRQEIFCLDPYDTRLKTHRLKGSLDGYWAFSVSYSIRVMFKFVSDNEVIFFDVGTHKVYK